VAGTISAVNDNLEDAPELVNSDPYGAGWIVELTMSEPLDGMLDAQGYLALIDTD
jgi:glycine cleavage system H protein